MRIRTQKKLTCMVWGITRLASMMVLAGEAWGTDQDFIQYRLLEQRKLAVEKELQETQGALQQHVSEKETIKEQLEITEAEKESLREQHTQVRDLLKEIKITTGGVGDAPVLEQVKKFRMSINGNAHTLEGALDSLKENLTDIPGNDFVSKVVALKETWKSTQEKDKEERQQYAIWQGKKKLIEQELQLQKETTQLTETKLRSEMGGVGDAPVVEQLKKFRMSINGNAHTLEDALDSVNANLISIPGNTIGEKVVTLQETLQRTETEKESFRTQQVSAQQTAAHLQETLDSINANLIGIPGENPVSKVGGLIEDRNHIKGTVRAIDEKLSGIPGDGVPEKVDSLLSEQERTNNSLIDAQAAFSNQEAISQALHNDLANAIGEINRLKKILFQLDEEVAANQVDVWAGLNHLLGKYFPLDMPGK